MLHEVLTPVQQAANLPDSAAVKLSASQRALQMPAAQLQALQRSVLQQCRCNSCGQWIGAWLTPALVPVGLLVTNVLEAPLTTAATCSPSTHAVSDVHRLPASGSKEHSMLMRSPAHSQ